jgi:hypothetical protein
MSGPILTARSRGSPTHLIHILFNGIKWLQYVTLLKDRQNRQRFRRTAYEYSRAMIWPNVAMKYVNAYYHTLGL